MKRGRQRRPLAAGRDVAAPEVRHRRDAGAFRDDARIAELNGERRGRARCVVHRLSMAADRRYVAGIGLGGVEELERRARKDGSELRIRVPEAERSA